MQGMTVKIPGPFEPPLRKRPSRKMTARSYSATTCEIDIVHKCNSSVAVGIFDWLFVISASNDSSGKLPANIAEIAHG